MTMMKKVNMMMKIITKTEVSKVVTNLISDVSDFMQSEKFKNWLETDMHFRHSKENARRIMQQMPKATRVTTEQEWRELGREVRFEAEPILIVSDVPNIRSPTESSFGTVHLSCNQPQLLELYDISQTYGVPLPKLIRPLKGNAPTHQRLFDVLCDVSPVQVTVTDSLPCYAYGSYSGTEILIQKNSSKLHQCKSLIHELSHVLYDYRKYGKTNIHQSRIRAEAVACVVLRCVGIDSYSYSVGYISQYLSECKTNELSEQFTVITNLSFRMLSKIQQKLNIDL